VAPPPLFRPLRHRYFSKSGTISVQPQKILKKKQKFFIFSEGLSSNKQNTTELNALDKLSRGVLLRKQFVLCLKPWQDIASSAKILVA
jgi:hypothetical protein